MNNEDIKVLEEFLNNYKQVQEKYKDDEIQAEIERSCYFEEVPAQAIENLIKRNRELEEENKKYPIQMNDEQYNKTIDNAQKELKEELERQINAREISEKFIEDNFISKSKVREKIEELKQDLDNDIEKINQHKMSMSSIVMTNPIKIEVLQELLEES